MLLTEYLKVICAAKGIDVDTLPDNLLSTQLTAIAASLGVDVDSFDVKTIGEILEEIKANAGNGGTSSGGVVEFDVLPEIELPFTSPNGTFELFTTSMHGDLLEKDQTYVVVIDGTPYSCVSTYTELLDDSSYAIELGCTMNNDDWMPNFEVPFLISTGGYLNGDDPLCHIAVYLPNSGGSDYPIYHKIRIYKECDASDVSTVATEAVIPTQDHDNGTVVIQSPFYMQFGRLYTVSIAGEIYECHCRTVVGEGVPYIGNGCLAGLQDYEGGKEDDQYPFVIADLPTGELCVTLDLNTFPVGEDIHITCTYQHIGD